MMQSVCPARTTEPTSTNAGASGDGDAVEGADERARDVDVVAVGQRSQAPDDGGSTAVCGRKSQRRRRRGGHAPRSGEAQSRSFLLVLELCDVLFGEQVEECSQLLEVQAHGGVGSLAVRGSKRFGPHLRPEAADWEAHNGAEASPRRTSKTLRMRTAEHANQPVEPELVAVSAKASDAPDACGSDARATPERFPRVRVRQVHLHARKPDGAKRVEDRNRRVGVRARVEE